MAHESISPIQAQRPLFAGVDVGGTTIKLGIVDDRGRTVAFTSIDTDDQRGADDAVQRIGATIERLLADQQLALDDLTAVGLGTPGTLDIPRGIILKPHNLPGWRDYPIRDRLSQRVGKPVTYTNDASAAGYGEYWIGSGKAFHSMVLITLGTGVGSGIIIGDDISIDGENSCGSECGHLVIDCREDARMCPCGQRGHLEAYCSAASLVKRTIEALQARGESSLQEAVENNQELTGLVIAQHAEQGDQLALNLVMETADYLVAGIVSVMNVIDPAAVILGGAMNFGGHDHPLGRRFLARVQQGVTAKSFPVPGERITIDYAILEGDAGYIGAAGLARAAWRKRRAD
ncbi:MAG: ROK family protein [Pirellulaceae bacterium]